MKEVSICTLGPDFDHDGKVDVAKYMKITFGKVTLLLKKISFADHFVAQWVPGLSAGGCRNNLNLFSTNPQVWLIIKTSSSSHAGMAPCKYKQTIKQTTAGSI